jgi:putative ABC transport system permease protein
MSTLIVQDGVELGDGGWVARRAMARWAWRLFRREWRQQLLVLALVTVGVAATILGAAVATNTPIPSDVGFGSANHAVIIPGSDPHLTADFAAIRAHFGTIEVIESENLSTGTVNTAELRAQDPNGVYGRPMLSLVSGRYPVGAREVDLTQGLASTYEVYIGDTWHGDGQARRVVGLVENPQNLADEFALVAPGQLGTPTQVTVLFKATTSSIDTAQAAGFQLPRGAILQTPPTSSDSLINPSVIVLVLDTFGLLLIGLVAIAGFTVMAQRRTRALGILGSLGATDRHVRFVLMANGAVVGVVATLIGAALGSLGWFAYHPHLETSANHRIALFHLPWWLIGTAMALAIVTAIVAAQWPARASVRLPIVAALSGRPAPPIEKQLSSLRGGVLLAIGVAVTAVAGESKALAPVAITTLADFGQRAPIAVRLALRDLSRYRARSGSALGAICISVIIAVIICVAATARFSNVLDFAGPNLPANQLIVYVGCSTDGGQCPSSPPTGAKAATLRSDVAASLGTHDVLTLDSAVNPRTTNIPASQGGNPTATLFQASAHDNNYSGPLYVATPALLDLYGINQRDIDSTTDILTARVGLAGMADIQILFGDAYSQGPGISGCPPVSCFNSPKMQTLSNLPTGTSAPNTVITEHAVHTLGLQLVATGWLFQTARTLTPVQINDARQAASRVGATIETKSSEIGLSQLTSWATAGGILLALGVLAMTVGLIRSETAGDLRILTATGASSSTRRTLTATTAGAMALLGGLLGTAVAYLACVAFFGSTLGELGHPPLADLLFILVGMPLAATIAGWSFAGREPSVLARRPLE